MILLKFIMKFGIIYRRLGLNKLMKDAKANEIIKKTMNDKVITYEEINDKLREDFSDDIERLIDAMLEQNIQVVSENNYEATKIKISKESKESIKEVKVLMMIYLKMKV